MDGFLNGRKGYAPMSTFSQWFGSTLQYQIIPQGVSSKPGSLHALLFGIRGYWFADNVKKKKKKMQNLTLTSVFSYFTSTSLIYLLVYF